MRTFYTFHIRFDYGDATEPQVRTIRAASPGHAQIKCRRQYPGCRPLQAWRECGSPATGYAITSYEIVSTTKVEPLPAQEAAEMTFSFFQDCWGRRPLN
jgi:hypothetical protein